MASPREPEQNVSRRDMLILAGGAALAGGGRPGQAAEGGDTSDASPSPGGGDTGGGTPLGHRRLVTPKAIDAEVVVVGGGMAGVNAAIAAARNGASVVLVQDRPVLGGNASSEIRMHVCGADCSGGRNDTDARESGIIEEIRIEESVRNLQRSASMLDLILYDRVRREPNLNLLLNTHCSGVLMAGDDRIDAVLASRHGTEDLFTIRGDLFIDCTGDGRIGAEAGAPFRMGREGRDEFGESIAPPKADYKTLGSTLLFITRKHERPMPFIAPDWIRRFPTCDDLPNRSHSSWEYGYWWVEWGGELDTIKDGERIRDELAAAALGVWDHIKNSGQHPESANWALDWFGFVNCKRESRRFIGDYVLRQQDLERGETFEDGVAYGGWSIDLHPPGGIYSKEPPFIQKKVPLYNVPLRCLYSRDITNLLFAGRDISASHVAFGSTRVMATCSVIGQAAGTVAALCARHGTKPRELGRDGIKELQQTLLANDAYIIGASNSDPGDAARTSNVRASSETAEGPAENVIDGIHRGVYADRHRWISDPKQPLPQWIELRFREPTRVREVRLVFDTGLHRPRTLTHSDRFYARMAPGAQPETVKEYEIELLDGESARSVGHVKDNYQRKRVHAVGPATVSGLRILVHATHGDPSARIFEVRVYG